MKVMLVMVAMLFALSGCASKASNLSLKGHSFSSIEVIGEESALFKDLVSQALYDNQAKLDASGSKLMVTSHISTTSFTKTCERQINLFAEMNGVRASGKASESCGETLTGTRKQAAENLVQDLMAKLATASP